MPNIKKSNEGQELTKDLQWLSRTITLQWFLLQS